MKLQKLVAGVMVAALAFGVAPVSSIKAADGVPVDAAHFPDAVFREYVSTECDTDGNGVLSDEEINNVDEIYIIHCDLKDLTGIEYFTALTMLDCRTNQLTKLDISKNTALTKLLCMNNQLTSLDVSNNVALYDLDCYDNQLTELDVSKNSALECLGCTLNQLTTLDVSNNPMLYALDCNGNKLTKIDLGNNPALLEFGCDNNQLTTLDVSGCTALKTLVCSRNQLATLDVSKNTALDYLVCGNNQLTTLDVSKNVALGGLLCSGNYFTQVDVSAQNVSRLYNEGALDKANKILYVAPMPDPKAVPDKTVKMTKRISFKVKKVATVIDSDETIADAYKKGKKKVIVDGYQTGTATVMAFDKKCKLLGTWIVKVE